MTTRQAKRKTLPILDELGYEDDDLELETGPQTKWVRSPDQPYTLDDAIEDHLTDLAVAHAETTVHSRRYYLREFQNYVSEQRLENVADLTPDLMVEFARYISQRPGKRPNGDTSPISKSMLNQYLTALFQLGRYLTRERKIAWTAGDLARLYETFHQYRKGRVHKIPVIPYAALDKLVTAARAELRNVKPRDYRSKLLWLRNVAMLEALRASGMRAGELVRLRRRDFDHAAHSAIVTGKGDRERVVYFTPQAWQAMVKYWKARGDTSYGRGMHDLPAFAIHSRRIPRAIVPLHSGMITTMIKQLAKDAGITEHVWAHAFRHAFATRVLEATGDLAVVQDMLGHANPRETRIYAHVSQRRLKEAHRKTFGT